MGGCGEALERVEGEYHNQDILYKRNLFLTKEKGKKHNWTTNKHNSLNWR